MSVNVACSVQKCINPVIGQCTGYKKACGRYYCFEHSKDTLCANCASQKAAEEEAERVYNEYLSLAENVSKQLNSLPTPVFTLKEVLASRKYLIVLSIISLIIGFILFAAILILRINKGLPAISDEEIFVIPAYAIGIPAFLAFLEWNSYRSKLIEAQRQEKSAELLNIIGNDKKGFPEFWFAWLKQRKEEKEEKNRQVLMGILTVVGVIAVSAIASSLSESDYDRTRRAVRDELNNK